MTEIFVSMDISEDLNEEICVWAQEYHYDRIRWKLATILEFDNDEDALVFKLRFGL